VWLRGEHDGWGQPGGRGAGIQIGVNDGGGGGGSLLSLPGIVPWIIQPVA